MQKINDLNTGRKLFSQYFKFIIVFLCSCIASYEEELKLNRQVYEQFISTDLAFIDELKTIGNTANSKQFEDFDVVILLNAECIQCIQKIKVFSEETEKQEYLTYNVILVGELSKPVQARVESFVKENLTIYHLPERSSSSLYSFASLIDLPFVIEHNKIAIVGNPLKEKWIKDFISNKHGL